MRVLAGLIAGALFASAAFATGPVMPVLVGGDANKPACSIYAEVMGLDPKGFLAVREGAGSKYKKIGELHEGDLVVVCDETDGWYGIVYGQDDCGIYEPVAQRNPYDGPCDTGWVSAKYITPYDNNEGDDQSGDEGSGPAMPRFTATTPVMYGGNPDYDACASQGQVHGLKPGGDGYLSVRDGPGAKRDELDRLPEGAIFHICDETGDWLGIVYDDDDALDCAVGSPIGERAPYDGTCNSGWVSSKYVAVIAG